MVPEVNKEVGSGVSQMGLGYQIHRAIDPYTPPPPPPNHQINAQTMKVKAKSGGVYFTE